MDLNIIPSKINLFLPWYSWKIAELVLNNNHSLQFMLIKPVLSDHLSYVPVFLCSLGLHKTKFTAQNKRFHNEFRHIFKCILSSLEFYKILSCSIHIFKQHNLRCASFFGCITELLTRVEVFTYFPKEFWMQNGITVFRRVRVMMFNTILNSFSVILWWSVLLVE